MGHLNPGLSSYYMHVYVNDEPVDSQKMITIPASKVMKCEIKNGTMDQHLSSLKGSNPGFYVGGGVAKWLLKTPF